MSSDPAYWLCRFDVSSVAPPAHTSLADVSSAARPAHTRRQTPWQIGPSLKQVEVKQFTHERKLPLAPSLDVNLDGAAFKAQYLGHGKSKIAYLLKAGKSHALASKVLKLTKEVDPEPNLFEELASTGLYPNIYAVSSDVIEHNSVGQPVGQWYAWVADLAIPLDQYLRQAQLPQGAESKCIIGAIRCMLHAASHGHTMSDNALFNFGKLLDDIVIIDAGSRARTTALTKSEFNSMCMKKFWYKVQLGVHRTVLSGFVSAWQQANDMQDARNTFDELWKSMHGPSNAERPAPLNPANDSGPNDGQRVEPPSPTPGTACPNVAALLECVSEESLDWLVQNFLWGKISEYTLSSEGTLAFNPSCGRVSADIKLELLIKLTRERRQLLFADPLYVLSEEELQSVLEAWKNDYKQWMHPEKLHSTYSYNPQQWHQALRQSFRTFLFHLVGCYEMTIFFLIVPFTPDNLDLFQHCWMRSATNAEALALSKRLARNPWPALHSLPDTPSISTPSAPQWNCRSRRY